MVLRFCLHLSRLISLRRESQAKITLFIAVVKSTHITSESYFGYLTSKSDSEAIDKIQRVCFSPAIFFLHDRLLLLEHECDCYFNNECARASQPFRVK